MTELDLEQASQELTSDIRDVLTELKLTTKVQGKRISAKPKKGYVCVLTVLEEIELETQFISSFQKVFKPIKAHANTQFDSLSQFIRSNGGINYSVNRVRDYLKITTIDGTNPTSIYASSVYGSLLDVQASTSRRDLRQSSFTLPYCAFCWRRVEDSAGYCQIHHPNQSKRSFYKAKSALEFAVQHTQSKYQDEYHRLKAEGFRKHGFSKYAFKWTASFARHPSLINRYLNNDEISDKNIKDISGSVLKFTQNEYPKTFQLLTKVSSREFTSWQDFVLQVVKALDPIEAAFWEAQDLEKWMDPGRSHPNIFVLLMIMQRHEAYQYINSLSRPRGPTKGAALPSKKMDLRRKIEVLVQSQKHNGQKTNRSEIARQLSLSRQRVSILMKELKIE